MDFNVQTVIRGKNSKDEFFESYLSHNISQYVYEIKKNAVNLQKFPHLMLLFKYTLIIKIYIKVFLKMYGCVIKYANQLKISAALSKFEPALNFCRFTAFFLSHRHTTLSDFSCISCTVFE